MMRIENRARLGWMLGTVVFAIVTAALGTILVWPSSVAAQGNGGDAELRAYWQGRFRNLRKKEASLVQTVKLATKEYADSNRRTYRRSGVRHFHRTNANEAKAELAKLRAEIATLYDDARAAGVPVFWLEEVAEEPIDSDAVEGLGVYKDEGHFGGQGAYAKDSDEEDSETDFEAGDDGRNPLYGGDGDDDPASLEGDGSQDFDYEAWREDRDEYESERAPEEHLAPGWDDPAEED